MFSERLLDHFQNPRNVGEIRPPALTVEVSNPVCGDILRLSARIEAHRLIEVKFKTRGCTASIAAGSALTELMVDRNREELGSIDAAAVEQAVGGLPSESRHAAALCVDAVKALLRQMR